MNTLIVLYIEMCIYIYIYIYLKTNLIFHFCLVVQIAEMKRTHAWLSFPGSKIKIHRLVVELPHLENLILFLFLHRMYISLVQSQHLMDFSELWLSRSGVSGICEHRTGFISTVRVTHALRSVGVENPVADDDNVHHENEMPTKSPSLILQQYMKCMFT